MLISRFAVLIFPVAMMVLSAGMVSAQNYPNKPIRIVTSEAGGSADSAVRRIAPGLSNSLGQAVVIENRGSGVVVAVTVSQAAPDGYTVLYAGSSFMLGPLLQKMPYDAIRDFSPITIIGQLPAVLVVHQSVPVKTIRELIDLAKAKAGVLNYSSSSTGSGSHLSMELFKSMTGVNIVRIPYKGGSAALTSLLTGEAQMLIIQASQVAPHVKSGKLKALAVTSEEPSALAPGLPTVAATVPGYDWVSLDGMWAPKGTPASIISRLNREIVRVVNSPNVKKIFFDDGVEIVGSSPEGLADKMKKNIGAIGKLIKEAGIKTE